MSNFNFEKWYAEQTKEDQKIFKEAQKNAERRGKDSFRALDHDWDTKYARYALQYVERR